MGRGRERPGQGGGLPQWGERILQRALLATATEVGRRVKAFTDDAATTPYQLAVGSRRALGPPAHAPDPLAPRRRTGTGDQAHALQSVGAATGGAATDNGSVPFAHLPLSSTATARAHADRNCHGNVDSCSATHSSTSQTHAEGLCRRVAGVE